MKTLNNYISEAIKLGKSVKFTKIKPKDAQELRVIIKERLKENKNADLNDIDVSDIKDMSCLFWNLLDTYNIDISNWNVSNVEDMNGMFEQCSHFNCDLSNWDVSNVKDMAYMFYNCNSYEGNGLENWNVSNVKTMKYMFDNCSSLKSKPSWYKK